MGAMCVSSKNVGHSQITSRADSPCRIETTRSVPHVRSNSIPLDYTCPYKSASRPSTIRQLIHYKLPCRFGTPSQSGQTFTVAVSHTAKKMSDH
jgi:hypothetical protein